MTGNRNLQWFVGQDEMALHHRTALGTIGYDLNRITSRPIISICNPRSKFNNCEIGFNKLIPIIKRGVIEAGGMPLEFPTIVLGVELLKPSDVLYRNLVLMDVEETIRGYPIDRVVLLCNCDKTILAQLMAEPLARISR